MASQGEVGGDRCAVQRVLARVELQSRVLEQIQERARARQAPRRLLRMNANPESLNLYVSLSADTSDGQRVHTGGPDFGIGGPRHGIWHSYHGPLPPPEDPREHRVGPADIEDAINQMLGRDPTLHRPPRLS